MTYALIGLITVAVAAFMVVVIYAIIKLLSIDDDYEKEINKE